MSRMTRLTATTLMLIFLAPTLASAQTNVEGEWLVDLTLPLGELNFTMVINQKGENLTGYMLNESGQYDLKGTVTRDQVKVEWSFPDGGHLVDVTFTGKVDRNAMSGSAKVGNVGVGAMSAQRK
jgi:hypothetical protein